MSTWDNQSPILDVRNICSGYGSMEILRDISLSVNSGNIVGIIGSNGAGKTTLLRTLSGLIPVRKGEVLWDPNGRSLSDWEQAGDYDIIGAAPLPRHDWPA